MSEKHLHRYVASCGDMYYASAGLIDEHEFFDSLDFALVWALEAKTRKDWSQVWDCLEDRLVVQHGGSYGDDDIPEAKRPASERPE